MAQIVPQLCALPADVQGGIAALNLYDQANPELAQARRAIEAIGIATGQQCQRHQARIHHLRSRAQVRHLDQNPGSNPFLPLQVGTTLPQGDPQRLVEIKNAWRDQTTDNVMGISRMT